MGFESRRLKELTDLIASGVAIEMPITGRTVSELCQLAAQAGISEGRLILKGTSTLSTENLLSIGTFAKGRVLFKD
ncbi:hypothetical protein [Pseudomonas putida]|uniref:hypothetical protein n=1 Tax=Pseudomonas putida TaxID=303 RepID=UPI00235CBF61|nr:hypothetical protein [Pseudomonas putida]GLO23619.1 hypothetical protein PPUJ21368_14460 [Pseudomonas putida]HDS0971430.1 hypothetical protein [Pseudomonas putida]